MRLKLNRAAALTLTGTAVLATLSQVGGAAHPSSVFNHVAKAMDSSVDNRQIDKEEAGRVLQNEGFRKTGAGYTILSDKEAPLIADSQITAKTTGDGTPLGVDYHNYQSPRLDLQIKTTLPSKTLHKGDKILIGTVTTVSNVTGKYSNDLGELGSIYQIINNGLPSFKIGNDIIGDISMTNNVEKNKNEVDIWLNVTQDRNYATIPNGSVTLLDSTLISDSYGYKLPLFTRGDSFWVDFLTGNNLYLTNPTIDNWLPNLANENSYNVPSQLDMLNNVFSMTDNNFASNSENINDWIPDQGKTFSRKNEVDYEYLVNGVNLPKKYEDVWFWYVVPVVSPDGKLLDTAVTRADNKSWAGWTTASGSSGDLYRLPLKAMSDNMSSKDILNQLQNGEGGYSKQDNGSYQIAFKVDPNKQELSPQVVKKVLEGSYLYNMVYTNQSDRDKMVQNTLHMIFDEPMKGITPHVYLKIGYDQNATDTTKPRFYHVQNIGKNGEQGSWDGTLAPNGSNFNAELYKFVQVHYLDSSNKDSQVSNDSIMGFQNTASNYQLNIPKGYILDTKSGKNKDGTQYKWSADKKSIAYTFNEDQKVNDANPINIYITHGTHNTNDNSGKSTRTIQYTGLPDNLKPKDNVQTVLFKRSGVTDDVTGETTYGDWQPQAGNGHYTAVPSPTFAGYRPDQAVIPDTAATPNKNENLTVNYSRTDQNAKLTVHDDTANTDLNDYAENSTGKYQDQISFKTAPSAVEQELKDKGYNIVSDSFKGSPTYNADDSKNNFVIHVTHKIVPVTPDQPKTPADVIPDTKQHYPNGVDTNDLNKDVQRSIFYKYEDNSQAEPTVVQKAHFDRTVKVDAVTQKIVDNGTWATKDNYPEVATKSIDGYTPDKTKVGSATPSMTTNQDQTVVYHANDEDAAITYIDDTTGKVLKTDTQKAKYKQTIKFATDPNTQIQTYKDQGYILVSSDWKDGSTYQTDPARNKFTVHLKHGTSTVTPDKPKKPTDIIPGTKQHYPTGVDTNDLNQSQQRQITYTYADSRKQASPTITQKSTFHRTATVDNVTGKTTYTDWTTSDQYPEVKSPTIEGYKPDKSNIPVTKPELNQKQDVAVFYNPNPEQVDVIVQDNTGKELSKSTLHGNYNTDYSATTPVVKGYHLIKMPTNTHGTYKTHNDPIIYIYAPDSNSVPEQTDGTPKPDKSSYPDDLTPAKRSNKLPETGNITLASELSSDIVKVIHNLL